jgi:hypothetical protein
MGFQNSGLAHPHAQQTAESSLVIIDAAAEDFPKLFKGPRFMAGILLLLP